MVTDEAIIHDNIKNAMIKATERDTVHIFRTLNNSARVFKNKIAMEVVQMERRPGGCEFKDIQHVCHPQPRDFLIYTESAFPLSSSPESVENSCTRPGTSTLVSGAVAFVSVS